MRAQSHPDPRVLAIINRALDNGNYEPLTQVALIRCFKAVFGQTEWWAEMLHNDSSIATLVEIATEYTTVH